MKEKYPNFDSVDKNDEFKWDMGTIDTKWQSRYSVVHNKDVGIKKINNQYERMMTVE